MAFSWYLPIRAVSVVFAIVELGLTAWCAHVLNNYILEDGFGDYFRGYSPSQVNFLIFSSVWSLLALIYLFFATGWAHPESAGAGLWRHKFGVIAVDAVTTIFWFAGFIALAVAIGAPGACTGLCAGLEASVAFAAFLWALFAAALVLDILHLTRGPAKTSGPTLRV